MPIYTALNDNYGSLWYEELITAIKPLLINSSNIVRVKASLKQYFNESIQVLNFKNHKHNRYCHAFEKDNKIIIFLLERHLPDPKQWIKPPLKCIGEYTFNKTTEDIKIAALHMSHWLQLESVYTNLSYQKALIDNAFNSKNNVYLIGGKIVKTQEHIAQTCLICENELTKKQVKIFVSNATYLYYSNRKYVAQAIKGHIEFFHKEEFSRYFEFYHV